VIQQLKDARPAIAGTRRRNGAAMAGAQGETAGMSGAQLLIIQEHTPAEPLRRAL
jgi:hypothetical protein